MENTASEQEKQSPFASEPIGKLILRFAIPSVIALLVNSLYNIVDQIFIGWGVGYLGNGATNVVFPITIVALALSMMIGNGGAAFLSLKLGEGERRAAQKGVGNAVALSVVVSVVLTAVFLLLIDPILTLFGATDMLRPYALDYGFVIGIGLPFMMISASINSMIRADGSPKYAMFSMVLGAILNIILDPVFIFVFEMGVRGAAIATSLGQIASFLVSVIYLPRFKTVRLNAAFRLRGRTCGSILTFGLSSFITQFAITIVMALTNNLLAVYGAQSVYGAEIPLTATGIVMKVNQILISILLGIATGTQPIIGFNYGARNFARVKQALKISLIASEVASILAFLLFQFSPMTVVSLFGSEEGLYNEFAVKAFRIFLLLCPLTGFQTVAAVYLQAVGKPVKSAILSLARQIIFFVPAALLLPLFLGVDGVLWTGPVADGLAFLLSLVLLFFERKHLNRHHHPHPAAQAEKGGIQ
ncbi:MAG TPA: MATE family efflux transporter [Candidatus Pygmaiobacter gallistercoris]|nr:MATE family efflux transporter [Candidatus Pygmaiobacter gallistercoris]